MQFEFAKPTEKEVIETIDMAYLKQENDRLKHDLETLQDAYNNLVHQIWDLEHKIKHYKGEES